MIEWDKFHERLNCFANDVIIEIIDLFESEYSERMPALHKSIEEKDFKQISYNACYWKGIVAYFSDPEPTMLAGKLQNMGYDRVGESLSDAFDKLKSASDSLLAELLQYRKTLTTEI